jgi:hypothetical protein
MATLADIVAKKAAAERWVPPRIIMVQPTAFASEWADAPSEPVTMGLRHVSDDDLQKARAEAAKYATKMHGEDDQESLVDCFNDALLRQRIARTTCNAQDVRRPWFEFAEDTVRIALTTEGVKSIVHEIEVFETETSPLFPQATDEDVLDLEAIIKQKPPWNSMSEAEQRGTRRLIGVVLERFGEALARSAS